MSIIDMKLPTFLEGSNDWAQRFGEMAKTAEDRLWRSAYIELRNVTCDYYEGILTLRGPVPSFHLKQLAQSLLCEMDGVLELNNQLEVVAPGNARQPACGTDYLCGPSCPRCI